MALVSGGYTSIAKLQLPGEKKLLECHPCRLKSQSKGIEMHAEFTPTHFYCCLRWLDISRGLWI